MPHPPPRPALRTLAACLLFLALALPARAADYHVSPAGDDAGAGTLAAPFATIARALQEPLGPGDAVYLHEGVYAPADHVWIGASGSASQPLLFAAWPGDTPIIDGTSMADAAVQVQGQYVTLQSLTVRNSPLAGIFIGAGGDNALVTDCYVVDSQSNGIFVSGENWSDTADDVVVENCHVERACLMNYLGALDSGWPQAVSAHFARRTVFRDNLVENSWGEGIDAVIADGVIIEDNVIRDVYANGVYLDNGTNCIVRRNLIYSTGNTDFFFLGGPMRGIVVANEDSWFDPVHANPSADNDIGSNVVLFCRLGIYYGNYEGGGGLIRTRIAHNTVHGSTQAALQIDTDTHQDSTITGNVFSAPAGTDVFGWTDPGAFSGLTFAANCWRGGSAQSAAAADDISMGAGETLFVNQGGLTVADYEPVFGSPVIDAADPARLFASSSVDALGRDRGQHPDMGAVEYTAGPTIPTANEWAAAIITLLLAGEMVRRLLRSGAVR